MAIGTRDRLPGHRLMTEKRYAWDSEEYVKHSGVQYAWALELIEKLTLAGNESVLDIGCGDGRVTLTLAAQLPQGEVLGIDSSQRMIARAQKRLSESTCRNAAFAVADATVLLFDNRFDVVFSNAALHWVRNHRAVLEGIEKSLKPGGRLLLQMGGRGNARDLIDVIDTVVKRKKWRTYFGGFSFPYGFYGVQQYGEWLAEAGLQPIRVALIGKTMKQKEKAGLAGWIRTTWLPYTQRVPEELRETFITEVVDAYVNGYPPDSEGFVRVDMIRLEVEALKGATRA